MDAIIALNGSTEPILRNESDTDAQLMLSDGMTSPIMTHNPAFDLKSGFNLWYSILVHIVVQFV